MCFVDYVNFWQDLNHIGSGTITRRPELSRKSM